MVKDKNVWDDCAKECPGMNKGKLWPFEEIEKNRKAYIDNQPLHKEEVEEIIKNSEF